MKKELKALDILTKKDENKVIIIGVGCNTSDNKEYIIYKEYDKANAIVLITERQEFEDCIKEI